MKRLFHVFGITSGISCNRAIQTGVVILARTKARNITRRINYEPGLRHMEAALSENSDILEEIENEEDLADDLDFMKLDKAYDMDKHDQNWERARLGSIITVKKFFKSPPEPSTLTCNERECIRYLHKVNPVHWDVKTLSESFPATPDAIRKILKVKFNLDPERKKKIDLKVQKNWELLAQGKLQAAPEVLEHLKKFINRREVLLDQIKKADFYLPEVKEQVNWNNGEMSNILVHYEKAIQKLILKQEAQDTKMISIEPNDSNYKIKKQREMYADLEEPEKFSLHNEKKKCHLHNSRTKSVLSDELGKVLNEVNAKTESEVVWSSLNKKFQDKSNIEVNEKRNDLSYSEKLRYEDQYFTDQVKDIENTAFWNKNRTSQEKACTEGEKAPLGGPDTTARGKIWSSDVYPERIKLPYNKRGSGLTFRVKDCFYDDDGEFLYRVPGMVK